MNIPANTCNANIEHLINVAVRCLEGKVSIRLGVDGEVTVQGFTSLNSANSIPLPKNSKVEKRILELLKREKKSFTSATIVRKLGYRNNPNYLRQVLKDLVLAGKILWTQEDGYSWKEPEPSCQDAEEDEA